MTDLTTFNYDDKSPRRFEATENLWRLMQLENSIGLLSSSEQVWVASIRARFDSPTGRSITAAEWTRIANLWVEALARSTGRLEPTTISETVIYPPTVT